MGASAGMYTSPRLPMAQPPSQPLMGVMEEPNEAESSDEEPLIEVDLDPVDDVDALFEDKDATHREQTPVIRYRLLISTLPMWYLLCLIRFSSSKFTFCNAYEIYIPKANLVHENSFFFY